MDADDDWVRALELDLESMAQAESDLDRDVEVAERVRIERSQVGLLERLPDVGTVIELRTRRGQSIVGQLVETGEHWLLVRNDHSGLALIGEQSLLWVRHGGSASRQHNKSHRRTTASVYRQWARDRAEVRFALVDGSELIGRLSAAFADHLDMVGPDLDLYSIRYDAVDVARRWSDGAL